jgi:hypothetical protein
MMRRQEAIEWLDCEPLHTSAEIDTLAMVHGGHVAASTKGYFDDHSQTLAVASLLIASFSLAQAAPAPPISDQPTTETYSGPFSNMNRAE